MLIIELFLAGGVVMVPLLGFSIVAIALIVERIVFWVRVNRRQTRVVRDVLRTYSQDFDAALLKLRQNADLPIARIFLEALEVNHFPPHAFHLTLEGATRGVLKILKFRATPSPVRSIFNWDTCKRCVSLPYGREESHCHN